MALLKQRRSAAAAVCRRRTAQMADPVDRWTPAWLARIDGLLAQARGDAAAAKNHLERARRLFLEIGDRYDARQVAAEMD